MVRLYKTVKNTNERNVAIFVAGCLLLPGVIVYKCATQVKLKDDLQPGTKNLY